MQGSPSGAERDLMGGSRSIVLSFDNGSPQMEISGKHGNILGSSWSDIGNMGIQYDM